MAELTEKQIGQIKEVVEVIVGAAAPVILKAVAASRPGVTMLGELMHTEPARDYRKEIWIAGFFRSRLEEGARGDYADACLAEFDTRFTNPEGGA